MASFAKFLSPYLKVESVKQPTTVTIASAAFEELGQEKESKLVLYFRELDQGLVPAKCVLEFLREDIGGVAETDLLIGRQYTLFVDSNVYMEGKRVGGLRLRPVDAPAVAKRSKKAEVEGLLS